MSTSEHAILPVHPDNVDKLHGNGTLDAGRNTCLEIIISLISYTNLTQASFYVSSTLSGTSNSQTRNAVWRYSGEVVTIYFPPLRYENLVRCLTGPLVQNTSFASEASRIVNDIEVVSLINMSTCVKRLLHITHTVPSLFIAVLSFLSQEPTTPTSAEDYDNLDRNFEGWPVDRSRKFRVSQQHNAERAFPVNYNGRICAEGPSCHIPTLDKASSVACF
ncbi:hypothetical protein DFS33DRAFT_558149 [Desarmillaria ectypa]|nr:hypothetical protein DFS33DRAFT_558149 [Desarmillaria ectypa]